MQQNLWHIANMETSKTSLDCREYDSGVLIIDHRSKRCFVFLDDKEIVELQLTRLEYNLLDCFVVNEGACLSREQLLDDVWLRPFDTGTNTVDVAVHSLRKKMARVQMHHRIKTVRSFGYRYDKPCKPGLCPKTIVKPRLEL
ncbi:MAG: winged helix-turn-helix transcriptional regulator [Rhodothermales bacterium]|nr:winged helix-turn-helix transcriptional regulator [Rhodothermales bacterium]